MERITSDPTHHSFGHNTTYARATTGTEENFILEYTILENSRRVNNGVNNPMRLRHFDDGSGRGNVNNCFRPRLVSGPDPFLSSPRVHVSAVKASRLVQISIQSTISIVAVSIVDCKPIIIHSHWWSIGFYLSIDG